jgi:hypothetical protein
VSGKVRTGKGIHGTPDDVAQWGTYEQAKAFCDAHPDYLPAFALGPDGKGGCWQAIDRDETLDGSDKAPGYVEISRSGKGYHVFGYGEVFSSLNKDSWEAYSDRKLIAVTERMVNDGPVVDLKPFVEKWRKKLGVDVGDTRAIIKSYIDAGVIPDGERNNAMTAFVGHAVSAWARGMCTEIEANAWDAGNEAGWMQREGVHDEQEEERFDGSGHHRHEDPQAGAVQVQDQARPTGSHVAAACRSDC